MIRRLVERFRKQGSVCDLPLARRPHSSVIPENVERVKCSIEECAGTYTRRRSAELNMDRTTLLRILHNLHLFPYKIQLVHELKPTDYQERLDYAVRIQKFREVLHLDGFHGVLI